MPVPTAISAYGRIVVLKRSGQDSASFDLTEDTYLFGRAPHCDIRIQLATIAEEHCRFSRNSDGKGVVENLSCIGTIVNGVTLNKGDSHLLQKGDIVTVVERSFRFEDILEEQFTASLVNNEAVQKTPSKQKSIGNTPVKSLLAATPMRMAESSPTSTVMDVDEPVTMTPTRADNNQTSVTPAKMISTPLKADNDLVEENQAMETSVECATPTKMSTPVKVSTPKNVSTPNKTLTPVKVSTLGKVATPTKVSTPVKCESPFKNMTPIKSHTPVRTATPIKFNTPIKADSPCKTPSKILANTPIPAEAVIALVNTLMPNSASKTPIRRQSPRKSISGTPKNTEWHVDESGDFVMEEGLSTPCKQMEIVEKTPVSTARSVGKFDLEVAKHSPSNNLVLLTPPPRASLGAGSPNINMLFPPTPALAAASRLSDAATLGSSVTPQMQRVAGDLLSPTTPRSPRYSVTSGGSPVIVDKEITASPKLNRVDFFDAPIQVFVDEECKMIAEEGETEEIESSNQINENTFEVKEQAPIGEFVSMNGDGSSIVQEEISSSEDKETFDEVANIEDAPSPFQEASDIPKDVEGDSDLMETDVEKVTSDETLIENAMEIDMVGAEIVEPSEIVVVQDVEIDAEAEIAEVTPEGDSTHMTDNAEVNLETDVVQETPESEIVQETPEADSAVPEAEVSQETPEAESAPSIPESGNNEAIREDDVAHDNIEDDAAQMILESDVVQENLEAEGEDNLAMNKDIGDAETTRLLEQEEYAPIEENEIDSLETHTITEVDPNVESKEKDVEESIGTAQEATKVENLDEPVAEKVPTSANIEESTQEKVAEINSPETEGTLFQHSQDRLEDTEACQSNDSQVGSAPSTPRRSTRVAASTSRTPVATVKKTPARKTPAKHLVEIELPLPKEQQEDEEAELPKTSSRRSRTPAKTPAAKTPAKTPAKKSVAEDEPKTAPRSTSKRVTRTAAVTKTPVTEPKKKIVKTPAMAASKSTAKKTNDQKVEAADGTSPSLRPRGIHAKRTSSVTFERNENLENISSMNENVNNGNNFTLKTPVKRSLESIEEEEGSQEGRRKSARTRTPARA